MPGHIKTSVEAKDLIYLLLAVLCVILNGLMVYITCLRRRKEWPIDSILLLMIGLLDLLAGLVAIVLQIWKFNSSYPVSERGSTWCYCSAVLAQGTILVTIVLTSFLATIRYLVIVRGRCVSNKNWTIVAIFLASSCWALLILNAVAATPSLGPSGLYCSFTTEEMAQAKITLILIIFPSEIITPILYSCLTHQNHMLMHRARELYGEHLPQVFSLRFYGLVAIVISYILTLLPELTMALLKRIFDLDFPGWVYSTGRLLTFSLTIVNALFALLFHEDINRELLRLIERSRLRSSDQQSRSSVMLPNATPKRDPNRTSTFLYFDH